jgi:hypothetical protein
MKTHQQIDQRSLRLARAVVEKLEDGDPRTGVALAQENNRRWNAQNPSRLHEDWTAILSGKWENIREILLDKSERGAQLRQNNPFCGILTPQERWKIYREFNQETQEKHER